METITSVRNERVKQWAELKTPKGRKAQDRYLVEGVRSVEEALASSAPIEVVLIDEDQLESGKLDLIVNGCASMEIELIAVHSMIIEKIADTKTPQGALAIVKPYQHEFSGVLQKQTAGLYVMLDRISDPGNLGTLIRTADAVGASGVIVSKGSADLYNPKVVRATMGSLFHLPIFQGDLIPYLSELRQANIRILGTAAYAHREIFQVDLSGGIAFIIGSEAHGLDAELESFVDEMAGLPMPGRAESLNAAIAGSIMLYEAVRQRLR